MRRAGNYIWIRRLNLTPSRRTLSRDQKFEVEKEQALRLVRHLLSLPDAERPVQPAVIRGVVALAESQEEKLRIASLETLGELRTPPFLAFTLMLLTFVFTVSPSRHLPPRVR